MPPCLSRRRRAAFRRLRHAADACAFYAYAASALYAAAFADAARDAALLPPQDTLDDALR